MVDFSFLKNNGTGKWVISAPRRSHRTNVEKQAPICPFCLGREKEDNELYRVPALPAGGGGKALDTNWHIRVIPNKFPFTPHHEIIIHSPDHHKNFDELPFAHVELILQTYRQHYLANQKYGHVYIFHNRGHAAGESLPHPHTQLTVIPHQVSVDIPHLHSVTFVKVRESRLVSKAIDFLGTEHFRLLCPSTSVWPDEVWIAPHQTGKTFGEITDTQIADLAFVLARIVQIYDLRHGHEFPFNFYIYPGKDWYLRLIPRQKILGGFELGTGVMVNTQEPAETLAFLKEHFWTPDVEKIRTEHKASYVKSV